MPQCREIDASCTYLSEQPHRVGLAYIHIEDHSLIGGPVVPLEVKGLIREGVDPSATSTVKGRLIFFSLLQLGMFVLITFPGFRQDT